jgi:DNA-binding beta-propeller fold protein YncE
LSDPESVALAADGRTLYVANVAGEGEVRDGNGFISRISTSHRMLQRTWVTGLDAPKGAIVAGGKLYVWKPGSVTAYRMMTWMLTEADPESLPRRLQRVFM